MIRLVPLDQATNGELELGTSIAYGYGRPPGSLTEMANIISRALATARSYAEVVAPEEEEELETGFLSVPTIAHRLGVSDMTIYRLIHDEKLAAVSVGRSFRVDAAEYRRFVADGGDRDRGASS